LNGIRFLHRRILAHPDFAAGKMDAHFIEKLLHVKENKPTMRLVMPRFYAVEDLDFGAKVLLRRLPG
jgi:hypothetical protein